MKREEEVEIQARLIGNRTWAKATAPFYGYVSITDCQECAKEAIMWADEHPRKGLVDIDEVCKYIENCTWPIESVKDKFIFSDELRKAMEK